MLNIPKRRLEGLALLVIALPGLFPSQASAEPPPRPFPEEFRIGYQKPSALFLLKSRGELEKRLAPLGVTVHWAEFPFGPPPPMLEALNAGRLDYAFTGETPPVFAQAARGASLVYVAQEPASPRSEAILVPRTSALRTLADLKGKRIAVAKGSNAHYRLIRALVTIGLSLGDIQPVYLAPADARATFERGAVDAWAIWDFYLAAAEIQLGARSLVRAGSARAAEGHHSSPIFRSFAMTGSPKRFRKKWQRHRRNSSFFRFSPEPYVELRLITYSHVIFLFLGEDSIFT